MESGDMVEAGQILPRWMRRLFQALEVKESMEEV